MHYDMVSYTLGMVLSTSLRFFIAVPNHSGLNLCICTWYPTPKNQIRNASTQVYMVLYHHILSATVPRSTKSVVIMCLPSLLWILDHCKGTPSPSLAKLVGLAWLFHDQKSTQNPRPQKINKCNQHGAPRVQKSDQIGANIGLNIENYQFLWNLNFVHPSHVLAWF